MPIYLSLRYPAGPVLVDSVDSCGELARLGLNHVAHGQQVGEGEGEGEGEDDVELVDARSLLR